MKKTCLTLTAAGLILAWLTVGSAAADRPANRQVRQQARIQQGLHSGELTASEYRQLQREQVRIQRSKRRALSDGELSAQERVRLERRQDRASRHIYRAKHNPADRN